MSLIRLYGYAVAPKTTFALLHPTAAARLAKARWDFRHALAPRIAALAVALLALPLGILVGRLSARRD